MTDVKLQDHQSGPVAQSVEHRPFKAGVRGSSPRRITTFFVLNSTASNSIFFTPILFFFVMLSFFVFKVFFTISRAPSERKNEYISLDLWASP